MIDQITQARVTRYSDTGQRLAHVAWTDTKGHAGTTSGSPKNAHMQALLARAEREGVFIHRETW